MPGSRTMARPSSLSVRLLLALVGRLAHTSVMTQVRSYHKCYRFS